MAKPVSKILLSVENFEPEVKKECESECRMFDENEFGFFLASVSDDDEKSRRLTRRTFATMPVRRLTDDRSEATTDRISLIRSD